MPLNKINLSSITKLEFEDISLDELLSLFGVDQKVDLSGIFLRTKTRLNIPASELLELKILFEEKLFSGKFGNLIIDSNSTSSTSIENINSILDNLFAIKKVDYVKRVELVSANEEEIEFKIHSKIGLTIPLVIELPIKLERFLILNFKIKNGVKIFLKLINTFLKLSSDKSIIDKKGNVRLDIREIVEIPIALLHIIDNWLNKLRGEIYFRDDLLQFNLVFKLDKIPFEKLEFNPST